jgi:hypothetical protein
MRIWNLKDSLCTSGHRYRVKIREPPAYSQIQRALGPDPFFNPHTDEWATIPFLRNRSASRQISTCSTSTISHRPSLSAFHVPFSARSPWEVLHLGRMVHRRSISCRSFLNSTERAMSRFGSSVGLNPSVRARVRCSTLTYQVNADGGNFPVAQARALLSDFQWCCLAFL